MAVLRQIIAVLLSMVSFLSPVTFGNSQEKAGTFELPGIFSQYKVFDVETDEMTDEVITAIRENSYLDIGLILGNLPDVNDPAKIIGRVFRINTTEFRKEMYAIRDRLDDEGNSAAAMVFYLAGAYFSGFEGCAISLEEKDGGIYEFMLTVKYTDKTEEIIGSGIYYNKDTGLFYGNDGKGLATTGFDFNLGEMLVYATVNSWMREFGFCVEYDLFCYLTPFYFYKTRRFKFEYAGKEWMIQIWKGNYLVSNGAEVGVYNREKGSIGSYYNCVTDEEMLKIGMTLSHGDTVYYALGEEYSWWRNGFRLTKDLQPARELTLSFTIEMKDSEMLSSFCKAVDSNLHNDVTYTVDGLKVNLVW